MFYDKQLLAFSPAPGWRATPIRLSATVFSSIGILAPAMSWWRTSGM